MGDRFSVWFCSYPKKNMYILWAGDGRQSQCVVLRLQQDHVHTMGEQWEIQSQCVCLQLSSQITYFLLAIGDRVNAWFCSYLERSRTCYVWAMGDIESECNFAAIEQDHVHSAMGSV